MSPGYWRRIVAGERAIGSSTEHYWRWPLMLRLRWIGRWTWHISLHGVRDGQIRGRGPFQPAIRSFLWLGPIGVEFGWRRQQIENWRWRRHLKAGEFR